MSPSLRNAAVPPKFRSLFGLSAPFGISAKFNIVFLVILFIAGLNVLSLRDMFRETDGVAETVNIAGKLRMLSQKMAFELVMALDNDTDTHVRDTMRDYETALAALEHGGKAFGFVVRPVPPPIQPLTTALRGDWSNYQRHIETMLTGAHDAAAQQQLHTQAGIMLASAEKLVSALTVTTREAQRRALRDLYALLIAEVLLFGAVVLVIRARLVSPLLRLVQGTRALAEGRYDVRVEFASRDEIGELVESFNAASTRTGALIAQIESEHRQLQQAEAMFRGLAENSIVGVCIVQNERFVFVNRTLADMFGYERQHMLEGVGLFDVFAPEHRAVVAETIRRRAEGEIDAVIYEARGCRADRSTLDIQVFGSKMEFNGATAMLAVMLDVSVHRAQQRELEFLANHDTLTGLANRNLLLDRIQQATAQAQRGGGNVAVLLLDLNDFKVINDSLGHGAGDTLLQLVARRLQDSIRDGDTVARFGGDEFVIVMPDVAKAADAAAVADKINEVLATPFNLGGQEIFAHTSIGIALYPQDGDAEALIKNADLAMYRAKRERDGFRFYSEELNLRNRQRLALEGELHRAIADGALRLEYQPKICLRNGTIIGAEALLRWQHPRLGLVSPRDFIPLCEETGLIIPIGEWVIRSACAQLQQWRADGLVLPTLAVNISGKQLRNESLPDCLPDALASSQLDAGSLELELTESILLERHDEVVATMQRLRRMGVKFSLDDFGTGYSSLTYLKRFPFDHLKLDKSFIAAINHKDGAGDGGEIVKTVISLGRALGLRTVAEGVETEAQLRFLIAHGCDEAQGFYFSPPLPVDAFSALLAAQPMLLPAAAAD
jgi:diguanylate cyclase (GGDEF)-like protein/PAS domain S-box-containing protein